MTIGCYTWNPKYDVLDTQEGELLLFSEKEQYILTNRRYGTWLKLISKEQPISRYTGDRFDLLHELISKGIVVEKSHRHHYIKNISSDVITIIENGVKNAVDLSSQQNEAFVRKILNLLDLKQNCTLIITDDYFDPKLYRWIKSHQKWNESILPLKISGERIWLGPIFDNQEGLCFNCVHQRLLKNQPLRKWVDDMVKDAEVSVPYLQIHQQKTLHLLPLMFEVLKEYPKHLLNYSFGSPNSEIIKHDFHILGGCQYCQQQHGGTLRSSIQLTAHSFKKNHDNGWRVKTAEQTLSQLQPLIDEVTGVLNHCRIVEHSRQESLKIFQSGFFKRHTQASRLEKNLFLEISLGKGLSQEQSRLSSIAEAIERAAAQYQGNEFIFEKKSYELDAPYFLPQDLHGFSEKQCQNYKENGEWELYLNYHEDQSISWTSAYSLTQKKNVYLPFSYCYANSGIDVDLCRFNSNGCAAGNVLEEAILQGLFEIIERDAVSMWWYQQIPSAEIQLTTLSDKSQLLFKNYLQDYDYWLLNLTHDLGIPVVAAIGRHKQKQTFRFGFGCHLQFETASERALSELCQLISVPTSNKGHFDFDKCTEAPFLMPYQEQYSNESKFENIVDLKTAIEICCQSIEQAGLEVLCIDNSRPELILKTVKVIVPGMCHIWPELGHRRLYEAPAKGRKGYKAKSEDHLNPMPLFV